MLAHHKRELICDLAEYYHIIDYRSVPGRTLGTLAVGLRADSRIGMIRNGIKASPETIMLVKVYDVLMHVFSEKGKAPEPLLKDFLIEQGKEDEKPMSYKSAEDFKAAWARINGSEK